MGAVIKALRRFLTNLTCETSPPKYVILFRIALKIEVRSVQRVIAIRVASRSCWVVFRRSGGDTDRFDT
jgi:hypothetical protein